MKALLVIDVQKGYLEKYPAPLLAEINARIEQAQQNGEFLVYIKNTRRLRGGAVTFDFAEGLKVVSSHVLFKERASAFSNKTLLDLLRQNQITETELIGIDGNSCIASSAFDARRYGYPAVLPCRCIGVQNAGRFDKTKEALLQQGVTLLP